MYETAVLFLSCLSLSLFRFRRRRDGRTFVLGEDGKELSKIAASERASGKEGKVVNEWLNGGSELQSGNDGYAMGAPSSSGDFKRSFGAETNFGIQLGLRKKVQGDRLGHFQLLFTT